jgi:hypothetical protein
VTLAARSVCGSDQVKKNREETPVPPEAASEESVASAELRSQVARQQLRLAKDRLKRARKQFKDAKREARRLRKIADAEVRALRRAMRRDKAGKKPLDRGAKAAAPEKVLPEKGASRRKPAARRKKKRTRRS